MCNKCICIVIALSSLAWSQLKELNEGSVAVFQFSQNQIVIGADSRISNAYGGHSDTQCKILKFDNDFVYVSTGVTAPNKKMKNPWSTNVEAMNAWKDASRFASMSSAQSLVHQTAERWATVMQEHLNDVEEMSVIRPTLSNGDFIEGGLFAATNERGELALSRAVIEIDLHAFDTNKTIRLTHRVEDFGPLTGGGIGLADIAREYQSQSSQRAKDFMGPYLRSLAGLLPEDRDIQIVKKLVDLCVQLDPMNRFLGLPVDELVLRRGKGVRWVTVKKNCRK